MESALRRRWSFVIGTEQAAPLDWPQAETVFCDTARNVALIAAGRARRRGLAGTVYAMVWNDETPRHENGCPHFVDGFTLELHPVPAECA